MKRLQMCAESQLANLDGHKRMTRRVVVPQPEYSTNEDGNAPEWAWMMGKMPVICPSKESVRDYLVRCAPLCAGDEVSFTEVWRVENWRLDTGEVRIQYKADMSVSDWFEVETSDEAFIRSEDRFSRLAEQSTSEAEKAGLVADADSCYHWPLGHSPCSWRPAFLMPASFARLVGLITNVGAGQLNEITFNDIVAEGYQPPPDPHKFLTADEMSAKLSAGMDWFVDLWNRLNARRGYQYGSFPWVYGYRYSITGRKSCTRMEL